MTTNLIINGSMAQGATLAVSYRIVGDPTWTTITITSLPHTITGLPVGEYELETIQTCENGTETVPIQSTAIVCECEEPTISQGFVNNNSFQVLYAPIAGSTYSILIDGVSFPINNSSGAYLATGLQPGRAYTVVIVRSPFEGVYCESNTLVITTTNLVECLAITNLQATHTDTTILATWDASTTALNYMIYLDNNLIGTTSSLSYLFTGLNPASTYVVSVVSICANKTYSNNSDISVTTDAAVIPCEPPTNVIQIASTTSSVTISWTSNSAEDVNVYLDNVFIATVPNGTTVYTLNGVNPNSPVPQMITLSIDCDGTIKTTNPLEIVLAVERPPISLHPATNGSKSVMISWEGQPSAESYTISKNNIELTTMGPGVGTIYYNFENLNPNTTYVFGVRPNYPQPGTTAFQTVTTMNVICLGATNVVVSDIGNHKATFSWGIGGSNILTQEIYLNDVLKATVNGNINSITIPNLNADWEYEVTIKVNCQNGGTNTSAPVGFVTTNIIPFDGLVIEVNHDNETEPNYEQLITFDTNENINYYVVESSELYIEDNDWKTSGHVINSSPSLIIRIPQTSPKHLMYRPCLVKITAVTNLGEELVYESWIVFDLANFPQYSVIGEENELPLFEITSLGSTTVGFEVTRLDLLIAPGQDYEIQSWFMKQDDLSGDYNREGGDITLSNTSVGTLSGLVNDRAYFLITRVVNITTETVWMLKPVGVIL